MNGAAGPATLPTPSLRRRLACFVYEGVLLFGVLMVTGLVFGMVTGQRHALVGQHALQAVAFVVLALYFTMKTWHIRVLTAAGKPLTPARALARFLLAWLWFMPALALAHLWGLHTGVAIGSTLLAGVLAYAGIARLMPQRQFLHDVIAATRLAHWRPAPRQPA
jgi:uncharacterized membrane protein